MDGVKEICWQIWQHPRAVRMMVPLLYCLFKQSMCFFTFLHLHHLWDNWNLACMTNWTRDVTSRTCRNSTCRNACRKLQHIHSWQKNTKYTHVDTNESTHGEMGTVRHNPIQRTKNCSFKCAYDCAQLQYTIQHRTVLIIFLLSSRQPS